MSLVNEQWEFLKDLAKLILFAEANGFILTGGELARPIEMQKLYLATNRSTTMNSLHLKRLAQDYNIFKDGKLTYDISTVKILGDYWESLNPKNKWGGNWHNFKDVPHFQRTV